MDNSYTISQKVGNKIKCYRKLNKLSLNYVAKKIGVSQQQQLRYEKGVNRINIERISCYATLFEVEIVSLLPKEPKKDVFSGVDLNIIGNLKVSYIYE